MGFDIGQATGNLSGWPGGVSAPTPKVTDLSAHVDGGPDSARGSNVMTSDSARMNLFYAAGIVGLAVAFLWLSGALIFRSHNL